MHSIIGSFERFLRMLDKISEHNQMIAGQYRQWTERWHGGAYRRAVGFVEAGVTILGISHGSVITPPDMAGGRCSKAWAATSTGNNVRVRMVKTIEGTTRSNRFMRSSS